MKVEEGRMKVRVRAVIGVAAFALLAAACAEETPDTTPPGGTTSGPTTGATTESPTATALPGADTSVCYISDTGGIDDKSFNQAIHEGFTRAQDELGIQYSFVESTSAADYAPNLLAAVNGDCDLIAPAGFNLGPATVEQATANPDQLFSIFDYDIFDFSVTPPKDLIFDNVRELTYQTDQAAFLGGYLAAGMTQSGVIATYGGVLFPTVTIFMNGLVAGVRAYNQDNGTSVTVLGWNPETQEGTQISSDPAIGFDSDTDGRRITEDFIAEGADIILPVAGPSGLGSVAAAQDAGGVSLMWVDTDGCVSVPDACPLFLTTVEKHLAESAFVTTQDVINGTFTGGLYVGTLENDGVGLADFHEFDSQVPQELKDKLEELKAGIIDGSVSVNPADYPA
jgi:basic membrane protein A